MVNKKLSKEDKIVIKYIRQKFGYGAKRIIKDHPKKNWFENTIQLKEAILQEWEALFQAVINNAIDGFWSRVRLVIAENGQHIEKY